MIAAGKLVAPVILTEFGQYCCAANPEKCSNGATGKCNGNVNTADDFSYNVVNMAMQYDISWTAWAWWGSQPYDCEDLKSCNNLRNVDGSYVSNGTWGGAPWETIWREVVNNSNPIVQDNQIDPSSVNVESTVFEKNGYLPRPCIMGDYNTGNHCGWDLAVNVTSLNYSDFISQSIYGIKLPGFPTYGNCTLQGCPTHPCGFTDICK
eukprot:UN08252